MCSWDKSFEPRRKPRKETLAGPPASSMAVDSLGSWFATLGQRSSSCAPSPALPTFPFPPPDAADAVRPPWRGPDHIWL